LVFVGARRYAIAEDGFVAEAVLGLLIGDAAALDLPLPWPIFLMRRRFTSRECASPWALPCFHIRASLRGGM
jgi:hypothetical protein